MNNTILSLPTTAWRRVLRDGLLLSVTLALLILISQAINPEIWANDYPPDIQSAYGQTSAASQRAAALLGIPFLGALIAAVRLSNRALRQENGGSFRSATPF